MKGIVLALCLLLPGMSAAQTMPALYDVARVAEDDVLNVRQAPSSRAEILGALAPRQRGVEVVALSEDGAWGQINSGETTGWVSMAFLDQQAGQDGFPQVHSCTGTEPFWGIWQEVDSWLYSAPDGPDYALSESWRGTASGRSDRYGVTAAWEDIGLNATIRRESCSDGMSDRAFGLSIDAILTEGDQTRMFTGCCKLASD